MAGRRSIERLGVKPLAGGAGRGSTLALSLEAISAAVGVTPSPRVIRRQARAAEEGLGRSPWTTALASAAGGLGLDCVPLEINLSQLAGRVGPGRPALVCRQASFPSGWLMVMEARAAVLLVLDPGMAEPEWMTVNAVAERFGIDPTEAVSSLLFFPAFPLESMKTTDPALGPRSAFSRLWALVALEREDVVVVLLFAAGVGLLSLATPIAVQALVNSVAFGTLLQPLFVISLLLLGGLGLSGALTVFETYVLEILQRRIFVRVTADLSNRLPRADIERLGTAYTPELVNRFFDVFTVQKATATLLLNGLDLALKGTVGLILLALYHPVLLVFDLALIATLTVIIFVVGRKGAKTAITESKAKYKVAHWLEEIARSPATFKNVGGSSHAQDRVDELAYGYLSARAAHFRIVLRQTIGSVGLQAVASAVLLGVGGWLVIARELTLGQLVAAEIVVSIVLAAFGKLGKQLETLYDLVAAVDKLGQLVDLPLEREHGAKRQASSSTALTVRLDGVGYRFPGSNSAVLDDTQLEVGPGERVGVVGASGSGKTTFCELLYGLRRATTGRLEIGEDGIEDLAPSELRSMVTLLGRPELIEGSILENVTLFAPETESKPVRTVLEQLGVLDPILALPDGLETSIGPEGAPLSSAPARLLGLARALLSGSGVIVVDEYLDPLPADCRRRAIETLFGGERNRTLIVFSDRADVLEACDRVYRLAEGRLHPIHKAA